MRIALIKILPYQQLLPPSRTTKPSTTTPLRSGSPSASPGTCTSSAPSIPHTTSSTSTAASGPPRAQTGISIWHPYWLPTAIRRPKTTTLITTIHRLTQLCILWSTNTYQSSSGLPYQQPLSWLTCHPWPNCTKFLLHPTPIRQQPYP